MLQRVNYKDYGGDYATFVDEVARRDEEHGSYLRSVQKGMDGTRQFVVKQKSAVSHIWVGLLSRNPQNPTSQEEARGLTEAELMGLGAHVDLVGDPGTGKTVICKVIAHLFGGTYERIQGKFDLESSDIIGMETLVNGVSRYRPGPVFNNIVLFDEINRARPTAQGAILEAMAEGQVTRDYLERGEKVRRTERLPRPFLVIATQNFLESEGVHRLGDAQSDRFAMQINMTGLAINSIIGVIDLNEEIYAKYQLKPVLTVEEVLSIRQFIQDKVFLSPLAERYAARLAKAVNPYNDLPRYEQETDAAYLAAHKRIHEQQLDISGRGYHIRDLIKGGMYNRMSVVMASIAKTFAFLRGRRFVLPEDVAKAFMPASRHRVFLNQRAEGLVELKPITTEGRRLDRVELTDLMLRHVKVHVPIPLGGLS